jgi:hypothetical protein
MWAPTSTKFNRNWLNSFWDEIYGLKALVCTSCFHMRAVCPTDLVLFSLITLTKLKEEFKLRRRAGVAEYNVWLRTGRLGFDSWQRQGIFPVASASTPALGPTQPPVGTRRRQPTGGPFPGGKAWPERDADPSSLSSAEIRNEDTYSPPKHLHGV